MGKNAQRLIKKTLLVEMASLNFWIVTLGLAFCRSWIVLCLSSSIISGLCGSSHLIYLLAGSIASFAVFRLAGKRLSSAPEAKRLQRLAGLLACVHASGTPIAISLGNQALLVFLVIAGGAGSGLIQILWGERYAANTLRFTLLGYPASQIVIAILIALAFAGGSLLALFVFPLMSYMLYLVCQALETRDLPLKSPVEDTCSDVQPKLMQHNAGTQRRPIGRLMVSICVFSLLCRLFDAFTIHVSDDPFALFGGASVFALVVVGFSFLVFMLFFHGSFNPVHTYRLSLLLMTAGMAVVSLFLFDQWSVSILIVGIGYEFFDIVSWLLFVDLSQRETGEGAAYRIFGCGVSATLFGMALGYLAGSLLESLVSKGMLELPTVIIICMLTLMVTALLVIPEEFLSALFPGKRRQTPKQGFSEDERKDSAALKLIASDYHLTPREQDVIALLAKGRTLAIIARELQVAKSTARTHIDNIYKKLNVHKQQELIDLVESYKD